MPRGRHNKGISLPRRKACDTCSANKVRCNHEWPACSRCKARGLQCTYPEKPQAQGTPNADSANGVSICSFTNFEPRLSNQALGSGLTVSATRQAKEQTTTHATTSPNTQGSPSEVGDLQRSQYDGWPTAGLFQQGPHDLVCNIDASTIQNRWLRPFIPEPDQQIKSSPPGIEAYIARILKSYTSAIIHSNDTPPFVHEQQMKSTASSVPLTNCFDLLRVCNSHTSEAPVMARELIEQVMSRGFEQRLSDDASTLLARFQAHLIYIMTLFFHLGQEEDMLLRQHMVNLQQLACETASHGLLCLAELDHARPQWLSWIMTEAKRRTLYTMYLFDNLLCVRDGLSVYISTELTGLPAPASKRLWRASSEVEWKAAYNAHLSRWKHGGLHIDELWPIPSSLLETDVLKRRGRVDAWLESVDEYGTMLYAVTICTHGG